MSLWLPTRRDIIRAAPFALGAAITPSRIFAAVERPLRFMVVGDWGRQGNADQCRVARLAADAFAEVDCEFMVSTGDNFYIWGVPSGALTPWQTSYENVYHPRLKRNWFSVPGNHDYSGSVDAQIAYRSPGFQEDRSQPPPWGWRMDNRWWDLNLACFGRPDIHLFFVDTVTWEGKEAFPHNIFGQKVVPEYRERQRQWLARALDASTAPIRLVIGHHPIFSVGPHGGAKRLCDLDCILRKGGATAYICGHDHCLYHIHCDGMEYVCSGAGSQVLTERTCILETSCPDPASPGPRDPVLRSYFAKGGVGIFSIYRSKIEFVFRTVAGTCSRTSRFPVRVAGRLWEYSSGESDS